jgi:dolichol-phosphate mannosyltransferase
VHGFRRMARLPLPEDATMDFQMSPQAKSRAGQPTSGEPPLAGVEGASSAPQVDAPAPPAAGAELSVVVPTFGERGNVAELVRRLEAALAGRSWEVIFVDDDSPDGTADLVCALGRTDGRIRCIQRIGRRGLASACIEGMLASTAPYQAVMDADLQHDETLLPRMLDVLQAGDADIVVGSRYLAPGGLGELDESRARISRFATKLSRLVLHCDLKDPMSGFFMIRREAFAERVRALSGIGFKILLDLFASSAQPLRYRELPYEFRRRLSGESKLDSQAVWEYLMLLLDKLVGRFVPVRFVAFALVGTLGIGVHLATVWLLFRGLQVGFPAAQAAATLVAITSNFALNNVLTYRDMRLRGWKWFTGWLSFLLACSVGALANVGIASYLFESSQITWVPAALAGIVVGAVWNYAVTAVYTWHKPARG